MPAHAAFLLPDAGAGGAERLTLDLMHGFVARGARVDLVLQQAVGEFLGMIPAGVRVIDLAAPRLRSAWRPLRGYLQQERPDALLAAMWPLTTVAMAAAAGLRQRPRMVLSDHCALREQYAGQARTLAAMKLTIPLSYRRADAVIAVSQALAKDLAQIAAMPPERVTAVCNPVPQPLRSGTQADWGARSGPRVLGVGSLKAQKNFALLIRAFARLDPALEATLAIVGEGTERTALEALVTELGLTGRVLLPGFTTTPGDWYESANLFALSSDYEGFGNVLVEAMHCGLSVVATDCPHGPAEVLGNGRWGRLVPVGDAAALAGAIDACLATPLDPAVQRARAAEFSVERAVDGYWRAMFGP